MTLEFTVNASRSGRGGFQIGEQPPPELAIKTRRPYAQGFGRTGRRRRMAAFADRNAGSFMLGAIVTVVVEFVAGAPALLSLQAASRVYCGDRRPGRHRLLVGGFLGYLIFHKEATDGFLQPSGIIGSVIGSVIVLLIWTRVGGRSSMRTR